MTNQGSARPPGISPELQLESLRKALPRLLGTFDEAAFEAILPHLEWEWVERSAGEVLFFEGDPSDALYVLMSGRLQAGVRGPDGETHIIGEVGRGESVGEMGMLTREPRRATITALRDSVLARIGRSSFEHMIQASPSLALGLNRVIIERLQRQNASQKAPRNVTNIAVLSVSDGLKTSELLTPLLAQLEKQQQTVLHLTSAMIDSAAGRAGASQVTDAQPEEHRWLVNYLDEIEGRYALVLYEADSTITPWTERCLRQADEVLLVGTVGASAELSAVERACLKEPLLTRVRQTLVLLHPANSAWATGTPKFLATRARVDRHYHVRTGNDKDVARLARFLSGKAVGLVLAGGGARGIVHFGVFRALEEAGISIDEIGGTSIGSVAGACMACDWGWERVIRENRAQFLSNPTSDFNFLPLVSLLAGRKLDRILEAYFSGVHIEELWVPFFCVSSNYTRACAHLHTRGNLKRALLASMAIPGVFPPIVNGNDLLVDGGVFNNMPVDIMARTGVHTIMAVDMSDEDKERPEFTFDQVPGTWSLLMDWFNPKPKRRYPLPSMISILVSANTLSSTAKRAQVIGDVDMLFNPDVRSFGLLEWKSFDQLVEKGYRHAQEVLSRAPKISCVSL